MEEGGFEPRIVIAWCIQMRSMSDRWLKSHFRDVAPTLGCILAFMDPSKIKAMRQDSNRPTSTCSGFRGRALTNWAMCAVGLLRVGYFRGILDLLAPQILLSGVGLLLFGGLESGLLFGDIHMLSVEAINVPLSWSIFSTWRPWVWVTLITLGTRESLGTGHNITEATVTPGSPF